MNLSTALLALVLISGALAVVALYRQRPAAFIFAANQTMVLRWLQRFSEQGRPDTLSYTPKWVFAPDMLLIAAKIFAISVALLAIALALPRVRKRLDPRLLPPLPAWVLWGLAAYFALVIVSQRTIFTGQYRDGTHILLPVPMGGVQSIMCSTLLYEVCRRVWIRQWSPLRGLGLVFLLFLLTDYIKGMTGIATGHIVITAMLLWGSEQTRARAALRVVVLGVFVSAFALLIRMTRMDLYSEGFSAVENAVTSVTSEEGSEQAENYTSGPTFATHVLECVALRETGRSRDWRSLSDPIIFTFEPDFLVEPLGLTRPVNAPWELASYFIHLGGISVFGEGYWNGGYLGVFVFLGLVLALCYFCDSRYRSTFAGLILLLNVAPVLLQGINYGFSYEFRGLVNGLLQLAVYKVILPKVVPPAAEESSTPPSEVPVTMPGSMARPLA
jgi:hypothetical protein